MLFGEENSALHLAATRPDDSTLESARPEDTSFESASGKLKPNGSLAPARVRPGLFWQPAYVNAYTWSARVHLDPLVADCFSFPTKPRGAFGREPQLMQLVEHGK